MPANTAATGEETQISDTVRLRLRALVRCLDDGPCDDTSEQMLMDVDLDGQRYLLIRMPAVVPKGVSLSPREVEIVRLVAAGHQNKVIASVLEKPRPPERYTRAMERRKTDGGGKTTMATDYDSPRKTDDDLTEDSLQELQARRMDQSSSTIDIDPDEVAESLELPGADLSNEELSFRVIPRQADEFTCSRCFLVHHRSQLAEDRNGQLVCRECAA